MTMRSRTGSSRFGGSAWKSIDASASDSAGAQAPRRLATPTEQRSAPSIDTSTGSASRGTLRRTRSGRPHAGQSRLHPASSAGALMRALHRGQQKRIETAFMARPSYRVLFSVPDVPVFISSHTLLVTGGRRIPPRGRDFNGILTQSKVRCPSPLLLPATPGVSSSERRAPGRRQGTRKRGMP